MLSYDVPKYIDTISEETGMDSGELLTVLLQLELKNLVRQQAGKMFVRVV
jgi:predicted Rossmann fold nucleotide-binding protein DprA/Smf involved in DNA uptake